MNWIVDCGDACLDTLGWFAAFAGVFGVLVWLMPCNRGMFWWKDRRAFCTDLFYWFVLPLAARECRALMIAAGVALCAGDDGPGFSLLAQLPLWQQCLAVLLLQDALLYWIHRGFHTRPAWRFHATHHSPTVLDWPAAARFHLVNEVLAFILVDVIVLLLGFSTATLIALAPLNIIYSSMVHANLNWTFGPLRFVFASPVFHRWHHTSGEEGGNKDFASTFPFLDVLFGTFYMPAGKVPATFGIGDPDYPEDFWGQFVHPFITPRPAAVPAMTVTARFEVPQVAAELASHDANSGGSVHV